MLKSLVISTLLACSLATVQLAQACSDCFVRPQCPPTEITSGLCFNKQMPDAVETHESEAFQNAFEEVVTAAQARLGSYTPDKRRVIITDLDETLVSNLNYYRHHPSPSLETWREWVHHRHQGPYNASLLTFLKNAQAQGFSIMFITGRPATQAADTLRQTCGIEWDGAFFRPDSSQVNSTAFKTATRQMLRNLGYEIVVNIGDQYSDLDLPVSQDEGDFLLPNVLYSIP